MEKPLINRFIGAPLIILLGLFLMYMEYYTAYLGHYFYATGAIVGPVFVIIGITILFLKPPVTDGHFIEDNGSLNFRSIPTVLWAVIIIAFVCGLGYVYKLMHIETTSQTSISPSLDQAPRLTYITKKQMERGKDQVGDEQIKSLIGTRKIPQLVASGNTLYGDINKDILIRFEDGPMCLDFDNPEFFDERTATTTLFTKGIWSFEVLNHGYCGDIKGWFYKKGFNYLLIPSTALDHKISGEEHDSKVIDLSDIFRDFSQTKKEVYATIKKPLLAEFIDLDECKQGITSALDVYVNDTSTDFNSPLDFSLDKDGINIIHISLPTAIEGPCQVNDSVHIPYSTFGTLIRPEFLEMVGYVNK